MGSPFSLQNLRLWARALLLVVFLWVFVENGVGPSFSPFGSTFQEGRRKLVENGVGPSYSSTSCLAQELLENITGIKYRLFSDNGIISKGSNVSEGTLPLSKDSLVLGMDLPVHLSLDYAARAKEIMPHLDKVALILRNPFPSILSTDILAQGEEKADDQEQRLVQHADQWASLMEFWAGLEEEKLQFFSFEDLLHSCEVEARRLLSFLYDGQLSKVIDRQIPLSCGNITSKCKDYSREELSRAFPEALEDKIWEKIKAISCQFNLKDIRGTHYCSQGKPSIALLSQPQPSAAKNNSILHLASVHGEYTSLVEHWLYSLQVYKDFKYQIVSFDAKSAKFLKKKSLHFSYRPLPLKNSENYLKEIWIARLKVISEILSQGTSVIHSDLDAIWFKPYSFPSGFHIVASRGTFPGNINSKFGWYHDPKSYSAHQFSLTLNCN